MTPFLYIQTDNFSPSYEADSTLRGICSESESRNSECTQYHNPTSMAVVIT